MTVRFEQRIAALGAAPAGVGQHDVRWALLREPEGNEVCILMPHRSLVE